MLEDTLVVWGGEFGRTPFREGRTAKSQILGRDHYPDCFNPLDGRGGVKAGFDYGKTDDLGFAIAENPVHVHDLQATIMHLLGFDHEKLTYRFQAATTGSPTSHGHVVKDLLRDRRGVGRRFDPVDSFCLPPGSGVGMLASMKWLIGLMLVVTGSLAEASARADPTSSSSSPMTSAGRTWPFTVAGCRLRISTV